MPTASTSQILGNTECFEPYTSNIFTRRTLAGDFMVINRHLQKDLMKMGIWDDTLKDWIISNRGSIQQIPGISKQLKDLYKTVWEMSQKSLIDQAADRGAYICQSQSLNLFMTEPSHKKIGSMHMYAWKKGLKTGQYYLRTRPAAHAQQFSIDPELLTKLRSMEQQPEIKDDDEGCLMCGS
jgi:ribonucleoside-diphosphate reductase alpha chain